MNWLIACIAGFLSGTAGALGLGGGGVLLIYLTIFEGIPQIKAQGINLIFFIPCALIAVIIHARKKLIAWKTVIPCAAAGLLGAWGGSFLTDILGSALLSKIFAAVLIILGLKELFWGVKEKSDTEETVFYQKKSTEKQA